MSHPTDIRMDPEVQREIELIFLRTDGRLSRWARRLIKPLWLRAAVRGVVTFPPIWRLVRYVVGR